MNTQSMAIELITKSLKLRVVILISLPSLLCGCVSFHNNYSARSWNQTVAREQAEHENPNETSVFGGN